MIYIYNKIIDAINNHTVDFVTIVISIISIIVNILITKYGWHKSRAIYDIEIKRMWTGPGDRSNMNKIMRETIQSGKYFILHVTEITGGYINVILGRIKK
ncbi:MAG TPA: hypothetical protein PLZ62_03350 [bacterium]|nr:hypothetical protein [bacterium]